MTKILLILVKRSAPETNRTRKPTGEKYTKQNIVVC